MPHPLSSLSKTDVTYMPSLNAVEASRVLASYNMKTKDTILMLKDSASNVNLIPEQHLSDVGIPSRFQDTSTTLEGVGSQQTMGKSPLLFGLKTTKDKLYIYQDQEALILPQGKGPKCPLLSERGYAIFIKYSLL